MLFLLNWQIRAQRVDQHMYAKKNVQKSQIYTKICGTQMSSGLHVEKLNPNTNVQSDVI